MKAKAKVAVFYNEKRYEIGETLEIKKDYFDENLFEEIEETTTKKKAAKEAEADEDES